MENPPQSQASNIGPPPQSSPNQQKSFWKTDIFIVLALLVFWPVGLFIMWRYAPWRKWIKGLLTFFCLLEILLLLLIWSLIGVIKGYSSIDNAFNPKVANQSKLYICQPVNAAWARCTNTKYHFSFEYPANWNYVDLKPEGIGFSPSSENLLENFIIAMDSPHKWKTEEKAKDFAKGILGVSDKQETMINNLYATKTLTADGTVSDVVIVDGDMTYQFIIFPDKLKGTKPTLTKSELQAVFDHMADSFKKDK